MQNRIVAHPSHGQIAIRRGDQYDLKKPDRVRRGWLARGSQKNDEAQADETLKALTLAIFWLCGPLWKQRWEALTLLLIDACDGDIAKAASLTQAYVKQCGERPSGPPHDLLDKQMRRLHRRVRARDADHC